jgi:hypothetical protein
MSEDNCKDVANVLKGYAKLARINFRISLSQPLGNCHITDAGLQHIAVAVKDRTFDSMYLCT